MSKDLENENLQNNDEQILSLEASPNGRASSTAAAPSSTPPARTSAEDVPDDPSRTPDESASYDAAELKLLALQNALIGNFDSDNNYQIPNLQRVELINLAKIVQDSNDNEINATATIASKTLYFKVTLTPNANYRVATLYLIEDVKVSNTTLYTLSTELAKYSELNTPNFIYNARQKFNLKSKNENSGMTSWNEYKAPPINLMGELSYKQSELEMIAKAREEIDEKYVVAILAILKAGTAGRGIIREFIKEAKKNKYQHTGIGRFLIYRQILDTLITSAKSKNLLTQTQIEEINSSKTKYVTTAKAIIAATRGGKEKAEMAGAAPLKTAPAKSAGGGGGKSKGGGGKSGGGKSKGGGGGGGKGGGGGGGKSKKKGGKDKKDEKKKTTLIDLALLNSLSSGVAQGAAATASGGGGAAVVGAIAGATALKHANKRTNRPPQKDPKINKEIDPRALSNEINDILHNTKVHGEGMESNKEGGYTPKYHVKSRLKIEIHTKTTHKEL